YFAPVLMRAALHVFDYSICTSRLFVLLFAVLAGYGLCTLLLRRVAAERASFTAAAIVALALAIYWIELDQGLHTDKRYYMRTLLIVATPAFGALAALSVLHAQGWRLAPLPLLPRLFAQLQGEGAMRVAAGALALVLLVHAVETAKFVRAWDDYKA